MGSLGAVLTAATRRSGLAIFPPWVVLCGCSVRACCTFSFLYRLASTRVVVQLDASGVRVFWLFLRFAMKRQKSWLDDWARVVQRFRDEEDVGKFDYALQAYSEPDTSVGEDAAGLLSSASREVCMCVCVHVSLSACGTLCKRVVAGRRLDCETN